MTRKELISNFSDVELELAITDVMVQDLAVPAHLKGYTYIREGILMGLVDPLGYNSITKDVYPDIAKKFTTTPMKVERAIRNAIEVSWIRANPKFLKKVFGYGNSHPRPTNSEFMAAVADNVYIKLRMTLEGKN